MARPSLTAMLTVTSPLFPGMGRHLTTRFEPLPPKVMLESGNTVALYEAAVRTRSSGRDSRSVTTMGTSVSEYESPTRLAGVATVGGVLPAPTAIWKEVEALRTPSEARMVMVAAPDWKEPGVTVMLRFTPEPLMMMLPLGTSNWSEEIAVTLRLE